MESTQRNAEDSKYKTDANPISKKVRKILESKVETDKDMMEALQTVSTFFEENTLHNRRNLRRDIEKRSLQVNLEFLEQFRKVKEELDNVSKCVNAMNECCTAMTDRLHTTKAQTRDLINETTKLQMESKRLEKRAEIADAFLSVFQLKPEEIKALKGTPDQGITKDFFNALNRAKEIHADCKQLLHGGQHTSGLEIMDSMAAYQEGAYELLYRWIQHECRLFNVESADINSLVCQAFHALEVRPVLFKYSLDEFCTARRNYIVRAFIDALTKGGPGGIPKPIELLSHDPLRYVNDMLAWIHQALASEQEFVQTLLKECSEETVNEHTQQTLSQITDGLYRPFKIEHPSSDLVPATGINQVLLLLRDVLESHDSVLVPVSDKKENFSKIFASVLDPLLNTLMLTSTHLNPIDLAVYMLNCLHSIVCMLSFYEYTEERLEMLNAQVEVHLNVLISEQTGLILNRSGIFNIYNCFVQHQPNQGPASKLQNICADIVKAALSKFDLFLSSPDSYKLNQCRLLMSPKMREMVSVGTSAAIVDCYKIIFDKVSDPANLYDQPYQLGLKTVDQIKSLLS